MNRRRVVHWRGGVPVRMYYEAGKRTGYQKQRRETGSADTAVQRAGTSIREQARHLDQNHDLAKGALNTLVQNVIGPNGIQVEPQPRRPDGSIHDDFAKRIHASYMDWSLRPEVTHQHDWPAAQRLMGRTWLRDGEGLAQTISGTLPSLDHGTRVPFSLELIEADQLPLGLNKAGDPRIVQGVELNGWGRPVAYHIYKQHPGDFRLYSVAAETKPVSADRMLHVKLIDRIGQTRGVSIFAASMLRIDDIKDYEESERIAAKVAASMAGYIKKGSPDRYEEETDENGEPIARDLRFSAGTIYDDLRIGEEIGTIDTSRPNVNLEAYRNGQLRAWASSSYLTYSSLSKDYNGTYSAQRQELVEGYGAYGVLASEFIGQFVRPTYHKFLEMALLSGDLIIPSDVDPLTIGDAFYMPPQMPWIDPVKESVAWCNLEENGHASGIEIIRRRGMNPRDVADQQRRWKQMKEDAFDSEDTISKPTAQARGWELITSEKE
jgi:lambda family phage portal protein